MTTLFICRNNTGRSQVAAEFFKRLSSDKTDSRGTNVDNPHQLVGDRTGAATIIQAMDEFGIDMRNNPRIEMMPEEVDKYDLLISMAEPEQTPEWLSSNPKFVYWDVLDIKDQPLEVACELRDQILAKTAGLVNMSPKEAKEKLLEGLDS